jgi:hypothetical protein
MVRACGSCGIRQGGSLDRSSLRAAAQSESERPRSPNPIAARDSDCSPNPIAARDSDCSPNPTAARIRLQPETPSGGNVKTRVGECLGSDRRV